jgi:hypothetical protein
LLALWGELLAPGRALLALWVSCSRRGRVARAVG